MLIRRFPVVALDRSEPSGVGFEFRRLATASLPVLGAGSFSERRALRHRGWSPEDGLNSIIALILVPCSNGISSLQAVNIDLRDHVFKECSVAYVCAGST